MRVSYNGITSAFQADDRGSTPLTRSKRWITRLEFLYLRGLFEQVRASDNKDTKVIHDSTLLFLALFYKACSEVP